MASLALETKALEIFKVLSNYKVVVDGDMDLLWVMMTYYDDTETRRQENNFSATWTVGGDNFRKRREFPYPGVLFRKL